MQTRVLVLLVCLATAGVAVARADRFEVPTSRTSFATFPMRLADWQGVPEPPLSKHVLDVLGADDYVTRAYFRPDGQGVGLYIGYWSSQRQGDTIHSPLNCLPGAGWEPVSQTFASISDVPGRSEPISVNRYVIQKGLERQMVLYWYQSHGRVVASEYTSKFYLMTDAVRLNRTDGAIVRVIAPIVGDSAQAEQAAEALAARFIRNLLPQLGPYIPA